MTIDRDKLWTGELNHRALEPQPHETGRALRHDAPRRRADRRRRALARGQARDRPRARRRRRRPDRGRLPAGVGGGCRGDPADRRRRPRRRGLGLRPRRARPTSRQLAGLGVQRRRDREPDLRRASSRRSASRTTTCSAGSAKAVSFAAGEGITVAFFGVDGSRADLDFFRRAYEAAVEAGAKEAVVVDTIGVATPEAAAYLVGQRGRLARRPGALARPRRLRARDRRRGRRRAGGRDLGARNRQRDGGAGRQREPARGRARARGALRDPDAARPDEGARARRARAGALRLRARAVDAAHRRQPLHARERRGREPVPRPARDRAVLVGARRRRARGSCSGRRAASTRSG